MIIDKLELGRETMIFSKKQYQFLQECYRFTPRQMEVIRCICEGLTNNDIVRELKIGYGTLTSHFWSIFSKVGVKGKAAFIIHFLKLIKQNKIP